MKLRVILDANVVVSGLISPKGVPGQILISLVENDAFELILSRAILDEMSRCLFYPKVRKYIALSDHEIQSILLSLEFLSDLVSGKAAVDVEISDKDDKIYLSAALEGQAAYIVSGDSDLLSLGEYEGISIVTPKVFITLLNPR